MTRRPKLDAFTRAYLECALWACTEYDSDGNEGEPYDANHTIDDFTVAALRQAAGDCAAFQADHAADLAAASPDAAQHGHDFWLTRNRHGAGFWDRGYPAAVGDRLTAAAHAYGSADVYRGRTGRLGLQ